MGLRNRLSKKQIESIEFLEYFSIRRKLNVRVGILVSLVAWIAYAGFHLAHKSYALGCIAGVITLWYIAGFILSFIRRLAIILESYLLWLLVLHFIYLVVEQCTISQTNALRPCLSMLHPILLAMFWGLRLSVVVPFVLMCMLPPVAAVFLSKSPGTGESLILGLNFLFYAQFASMALFGARNYLRVNLEGYTSLQRAHRARAALAIQKKQNMELLETLFPPLIRDFVEQHRAENFPEATIVFAELENFSDLTTAMTPAQSIDVINKVFVLFDTIAAKHSLLKVKTTGEVYMAVANIPNDTPTGALDCVSFALDALDGVRILSASLGVILRPRIGVNTGFVVAGTLHTSKLTFDLYGDAVNIAHRMMMHGAPGAVQISVATLRSLPVSLQKQVDPNAVPLRHPTLAFVAPTTPKDKDRPSASSNSNKAAFGTPHSGADEPIPAHAMSTPKTLSRTSSTVSDDELHSVWSTRPLNRGDTASPELTLASILGGCGPEAEARCADWVVHPRGAIALKNHGKMEAFFVTRGEDPPDPEAPPEQEAGHPLDLCLRPSLDSVRSASLTLHMTPPRVAGVGVPGDEDPLVAAEQLLRTPTAESRAPVLEIAVGEEEGVHVEGERPDSVPGTISALAPYTPHTAHRAPSRTSALPLSVPQAPSVLSGSLHSTFDAAAPFSSLSGAASVSSRPRHSARSSFDSSDLEGLLDRTLQIERPDAIVSMLRQRASGDSAEEPKAAPGRTLCPRCAAKESRDQEPSPEELARDASSVSNKLLIVSFRDTVARDRYLAATLDRDRKRFASFVPAFGVAFTLLALFESLLVPGAVAIILPMRLAQLPFSLLALLLFRIPLGRRTLRALWVVWHAGTGVLFLGAWGLIFLLRRDAVSSAASPAVQYYILGETCVMLLLRTAPLVTLDWVPLRIILLLVEWFCAWAFRGAGDLSTTIALLSIPQIGLSVVIVVVMLVYQRSERLCFLQKDTIARQMQAILDEKDKCGRLLESTLPPPVLRALKTNPGAMAQRVEDATVFFADFVAFTEFCAVVPSVFIVQILDEIYARYDRVCKMHGVTTIATIGDCYFAGAGIIGEDCDHAVHALRAALEMLRETERFCTEKGLQLRLRTGLSTGVVFAGVLGLTRFTWDVWGPAVTEAKKLESASSPSRLLISQATKARVPRGTAHFREGPVISSCPTFFVSRSRTAR